MVWYPHSPCPSGQYKAIMSVFTKPEVSFWVKKVIRSNVMKTLLKHFHSNHHEVCNKYQKQLTHTVCSGEQSSYSRDVMTLLFVIFYGLLIHCFCCFIKSYKCCFTLTLSVNEADRNYFRPNSDIVCIISIIYFLLNTYSTYIWPFCDNKLSLLQS